MSKAGDTLVELSAMHQPLEEDYSDDPTIDQLISFDEKGNVNISEIIKTLIDTSFGGDNQSQMKAVQLLKGLATSNDPLSNKFMQALDKFTSSLNPDNFK